MPSATTSNYLHDALMNLTLKNTAWTPPSSLYVALYTTVPTSLDGSGGTEVSGGSYARKQILASGGWNGPTETAAREFSNAADITFAVPTADWGTIRGARSL